MRGGGAGSAAGRTAKTRATTVSRARGARLMDPPYREGTATAGHRETADVTVCEVSQDELRPCRSADPGAGAARLREWPGRAGPSAVPPPPWRPRCPTGKP